MGGVSENLFATDNNDSSRGSNRVRVAEKDLSQPALTFADYQTESRKTAKYPEKGTGSLLAIAYVGLGLGESGEVQGKIKKIIRDSGGIIDQEKKDAIAAELGDVLWYVSQLATELGIPFEQIASKNLDKLFGRLERGTICGSGDNR